MVHCRWCLRGQYPVQTTQERRLLQQLNTGSDYVKNDNECINRRRSFDVTALLEYRLSQIQIYAPNIDTVRIGTRVPLQDPSRVNDKLIDMLSLYDKFDFEFGINVCHYSEFTKESIDAIKKLRKARYRIYNQHPLLKCE